MHVRRIDAEDALRQVAGLLDQFAGVCSRLSELEEVVVAVAPGPAERRFVSALTRMWSAGAEMQAANRAVVAAVDQADARDRVVA
jgi:hypothetical protein